jgi:arabinoxylan arabinofuranohydrolase
VERTDDAYVLQMSDRDDVKAETLLSCGEVWLRMDCDFKSDTARFSYSTDGRDFLPFGTPFHMIFSMKHFTGNKFALFNYATRQAGGYVDIDSFDLVL